MENNLILAKKVFWKFWVVLKMQSVEGFWGVQTCISLKPQGNDCLHFSQSQCPERFYLKNTSATILEKTTSAAESCCSVTSIMCINLSTHPVLESNSLCKWSKIKTEQKQHLMQYPCPCQEATSWRCFQGSPPPARWNQRWGDKDTHRVGTPSQHTQPCFFPELLYCTWAACCKASGNILLPTLYLGATSRDITAQKFGSNQFTLLPYGPCVLTPASTPPLTGARAIVPGQHSEPHCDLSHITHKYFQPSCFSDISVFRLYSRHYLTHSYSRTACREHMVRVERGADTEERLEIGDYHASLTAKESHLFKNYSQTKI